MVQAKAPAGANSSTTSGFAAQVLDAKTPPAPYYHDADGDGIGAGEAEWYAPGDEPSGWVSRVRPDDRTGASNADQTDTDADGIGDAYEATVVRSRPHRPQAHRGERLGASQPNGARLIRVGAYYSLGPSSCPCLPQRVERGFSEVGDGLRPGGMMPSLRGH